MHSRTPISEPAPARPVQVAIVGAGPAGLMAAEVLSQAGLQVDVYDAMPSVGRKFLLAGIGGLNITHSEAYERFCSRYADRQPQLEAALNEFTPEDLCNWVHGLGVETFIGSSGRVFPKEMKAAPLLRAWLHRLRGRGVRFHVRHRWQGWTEDGSLLCSSPQGQVLLKPQAVLMALGGASWPQLGSDGTWVPLFRAQDVKVETLHSANCGFEVDWSEGLKQKCSGSPLKTVVLKFTNLDGVEQQRAGEMVISQHGVEGSLIYAFSRDIRTRLLAQGTATFYLDLLPGRSQERVRKELEGLARTSHSTASFLKSRLGIAGVKLALLREGLQKQDFSNPDKLLACLKNYPVTVKATRPIQEAISTAGGVAFDSLTPQYMVAGRPGLFVAGEMLDWEAPTGGYLLTACLATGRAAGQGVLKWLGQQPVNG